jgi:nitrogen-specific signal transduction histidine kinase
MANFNIKIPDEYLSGSEDFGFTTVDTDEFEQAEQIEREITSDVADELAEGLVTEINNKISGLEGKINAVLLRLEDSTDNELITGSVDMVRIEEKIDTILAMENTEMVSALNEQGENIRAIIDEVEERKGQLDDQYREKLSEVEKTVLPLLINLTKNPEREYLKWPDRASKVQGYIQRVLEITRKEDS